MKPSPTEAAATLLRCLADTVAPSAKSLADVARALLAVPVEHPLRVPVDSILEWSESLQRGKATPEDMRAWAVELASSSVDAVPVSGYVVRSDIEAPQSCRTAKPRA